MSNTAQSLASTRIASLLDENSFVEIGGQVTARSTDFNMAGMETPSDGVITGYGVINGSLVYVYSQDASVMGGTIGEMHAKKIARLYEFAQKTGAPVISISAREETGMEELEEQMKKMFFQGEISFNDEVYITNARHKQALLEAKKSLELTAGSIEMGMPEDFFSIDLMNAYEELGSIIGEAVGEDLVNEIFSKFCTGK